MNITIEEGGNTFDFDVTPVLKEGNQKCECCSQIGDGIHKTIDFDGSVGITYCNTGCSATADFEVDDPELIKAKNVFITKTREELAVVMLRFRKVTLSVARRINGGKTELFCCNDCWDEYQKLTAATLKQDN